MSAARITLLRSATQIAWAQPASVLVASRLHLYPRQPSSGLLPHRAIHTSLASSQEQSATKSRSDSDQTQGKSPLTVEGQNRNHGNTNTSVSEEVLKDRPEPGWALEHSRYQEEGMCCLASLSLVCRPDLFPTHLSCTELENVSVVHRKPERFGDYIAALMVGTLR